MLIHAHTLKTTKEDLDDLRGRYRQADQDEALAALALPVEAALDLYFVSERHMQTVFIRGNPEAVFGTDPFPQDPKQAVIWMVGTDELTRSPRIPLQFSKLVVKVASEQFVRLTNFVDARNTTHIRWLSYMGFQFTHIHPEFGAAGLPFLEFEKTRCVS